MNEPRPAGPLPIDLAPPPDVDLPDVVTTPERDRPPWPQDAVAISHRARALLATLRPHIVRALGFWDHIVRRVTLAAGRTLEIDPSGSYRLHQG